MACQGLGNVIIDAVVEQGLLSLDLRCEVVNLVARDIAKPHGTELDDVRGAVVRRRDVDLQGPSLDLVSRNIKSSMDDSRKPGKDLTGRGRAGRNEGPVKLLVEENTDHGVAAQILTHIQLNLGVYPVGDSTGQRRNGQGGRRSWARLGVDDSRRGLVRIGQCLLDYRGGDRSKGEGRFGQDPRQV